MWIGLKMQSLRINLSPLKTIFVLFNIAYLYNCNAFPVTQATTNNTQPIMSHTHRRPPITAPPVPIGILRPIETSEGRIFFDAIGNFISTSEYFPLELNVPDTIATVGQGLNDMFMGIMGLMGQAEQVPRVLYRMLKNVVVGWSILLTKSYNYLIQMWTPTYMQQIWQERVVKL